MANEYQRIYEAYYRHRFFMSHNYLVKLFRYTGIFQVSYHIALIVRSSPVSEDGRAGEEDGS